MNTDNKNNRFETIPDDEPILPKELRKTDVFEVPVNYFETLSDRISSKTTTNNRVRTSIFASAPGIIAVTAILVVGVISGILYYESVSPEKQQQEVILTYDDIISAGLAPQFDNMMLIEHYMSLQQQQNATEQNQKINDYLIENEVDITLIINEL